MDYKRLMWEQYHYRFGLAGEGQADVIQKLLEGHSGRALNVGCGPWGSKVNNLAACCSGLIAVDRSEECIRQARREVTRSNVALLVADAAVLPFAAASFGHVLALGLFAHIKDPGAVFAEFRRVCRSGAYVMMTNAVRHPKERFRELGQKVGFRLIEQHVGYCPSASGKVKRRYLLVFAAPG